MATELTDLELGEWSICIDPANEDSTIEIVKSKSGLGPVLKETDMSEHNEDTNDTEIEQFASEVLEEFNALSAEEQANAIVGMALENAEFEEAVEDAAEVIKSLSENVVPREQHEAVLKTLKDAGAVIEKMKNQGHVSAEEGGGLLSEITKANGGAALSPEAAARIEALEKSNNEIAIEKAVNRARGYNFGKPEEVADLELSIRKSLGDKKADAFVALIKQAGAIAKSSKLFTPIGEDGGGADASSPINKAKGIIADIRKSHPDLTEQQLFAKAIEQNPGLYRELDAARQAA